jgi:L-aspartate oxidase
MVKFDVLIIGSGAAGLTAALELAETRKVGVLAKGSLSDGATAWAQGGIAAVLEPGDTFEDHIRDTMIAGAGLNNREAVEFVIENAPQAIDRLASLGVPFNPGDEAKGWHLTREGGHSHRRIVHVNDATGWAVQQALEKAAKDNPNITLVPDMVAIDLILGRHQERFSTSGRIHGVYALNRKTGKVAAYTARATILATGGAGRTYLYSTAPRGATGDGIAMAWRAGCRVSNMEFMQFHPTCLYNLEVKNFLITEAVRGEGGHLKLPTTGERFMPRFDAREELAPRDVVARAIDHEIKRLGLDYVHLDISDKPADFIREHFPNIYENSWGLASTLPRNPSRLFPPNTIPAAVFWSICTDARTRRGFMQPAKSRSPVCTAQTAWRQTRCSNVLCLAMRARNILKRIGTAYRHPRRSALGMKAASPTATKKS